MKTLNTVDAVFLTRLDRKIKQQACAIILGINGTGLVEVIFPTLYFTAGPINVMKFRLIGPNSEFQIEAYNFHYFLNSSLKIFQILLEIRLFLYSPSQDFF